MKRRRRLMHVGSLGDDLVRRLDPQGVRHTSRVVAAWPQVAGPEVDAHTKGFSLRDGELLVYVDSPMWANELTAMSEQYRARLNQEAGEEAVRTMRFIVSNKATRADVVPPDVEEWGEAPAAPRTPLSDAERAQIEHAASAIEDGDLREAAVAAMSARVGQEPGPETAQNDMSGDTPRQTPETEDE